MIAEIIIDTDIGTDDAVALLILLHAEKCGLIKIRAIIATPGNTSTANIVRNTARLLELLNVTHIPIYIGAQESIYRNASQIVEYFHGQDGFGDLDHSNEPDMSPFQENVNGILEIANIIREKPNQVSLICLAPLTNVALLLKIFGKLPLKSVAIMGGNIEGVGNITSAAEYNFYCDPEASRMFFESIHCPVMMLPWEPCLHPNLTMKWRAELKPNRDNAAWSLITEAEMKCYAKMSEWIPCDAFLAACYIYPEKMIKATKDVHITVETEGVQTRGQVILHQKNLPNATVITTFSEDGFVDIIRDVLENL